MTEYPEIFVAMSEYLMLQEIAESADRLESWLHSNCGTNDDWPADLIARDDESCQRIVGMLNHLRASLAPWRNANASR